MDLFGDGYLPLELKILVAEHLSPTDLMSARVVCKGWLNSLKNEIYWRNKIPKDLLNYLPEFNGNFVRLFSRGGVHLVQTLEQLKKYATNRVKNFQFTWYMNIAHIDNVLGFHYVEINKRFNGDHNIDELQKFINEAMTFNCPYLAVPTKYFEDRENLYIVFDNQFEDLQKYTKSIPTEQYNEKLVIKLVRDLIHAMKYLHERNHSIVTRFGGIDMGIGRSYNGNIRLKLANYTKDLFVSSLVPYCLFMSPERIGSKAIDDHLVPLTSDLFSLGTLTLYLLTGSPIYDVHPMRAMFLIERFQSYEFKDPNNEISDLAKDFVLKLLKRDPNDRMILDEALNHPWLTNPQPSTSTLSTAYTNLSKSYDDESEDEGDILYGAQ